MKSMTEKTRRYFRGNPIPDETVAKHARKRRSTIILKNGKKLYSDLKVDEVAEAVGKNHKLIVSELDDIGIWELVPLEVDSIDKVVTFSKKKPKPNVPPVLNFTSKTNKSTKKKPVDIYLAKVVKNLRIKKGWSTKRLAMAMGLTPQVIRAYERGGTRIPERRLKQLAIIFKCSSADIEEQAKKLKTDQQS